MARGIYSIDGALIAPMRRLFPALLAAAACTRPAPAPRAPVAAIAAPDAETSFDCEPIRPDPSAPDARVVECAPGGGACSLTYTARRMTAGPSGYEVGADVPIATQAGAWRAEDDGERLHVEILDGAEPRLIVDALLSGAAGSEGTAVREFVGVARTPGAGAPAMRAVSLAGAPSAPSTTRDEARIAVRCALSTDLQE
jgi:hypothetical protein